VFAVSPRSDLLLNGSILTSHVTSLALHSRYVLFTTQQHELRVISRSHPLARSLLPATISATSRALERGSVLVAVSPYDTRAILQMPRGNLETIHPRVLALWRARALLSETQFGAAFTLLRAQRINLNLLCDHDLPTFTALLEKVVRELGDPENLNLFIAALTDDDSSATTFRDPFGIGVESDIGNSVLREVEEGGEEEEEEMPGSALQEDAEAEGGAEAVEAEARLLSGLHIGAGKAHKGKVPLTLTRSLTLPLTRTLTLTRTLILTLIRTLILTRTS